MDIIFPHFHQVTHTIFPTENFVQTPSTTENSVSCYKQADIVISSLRLIEISVALSLVPTHSTPFSGKRDCERSVFFPRRQHNNPSQISTLNH